MDPALLRTPVLKQQIRAQGNENKPWAGDESPSAGNPDLQERCLPPDHFTSGDT